MKHLALNAVAEWRNTMQCDATVFEGLFSFQCAEVHWLQQSYTTKHRCMFWSVYNTFWYLHVFNLCMFSISASSYLCMFWISIYFRSPQGLISISACFWYLYKSVHCLYLHASSYAWLILLYIFIFAYFLFLHRLISCIVLISAYFRCIHTLFSEKQSLKL